MTFELSTSGADAAAADNAARSVSVIIPHYNDLANLQRCIGLLAAQTLPRREFEVVVADNNSRCGIEEVRRVCGSLASVIPAPIQGAGPARNAAVEASRGRFLAFIDSDCRPAPTWLERGMAALSTGQIVGGRVDVDYEDPAHPTGVEAFEKVFAFNFKRYIEEVGFSGSGNMLVSREIFDSVGGFRNELAEDVDWGRRAVAAGYRFRYAPDVVVSHPARRTWPELVDKSRKSAREAFEATVERPGGRAVWFAPASLSSPPLRSLGRYRAVAQAGKRGAADKGDRRPFSHSLLAVRGVQSPPAAALARAMQAWFFRRTQ